MGNQDTSTNELLFKDIFHLYKDGVYRFAWSMMGNPEDAAEVSQEVFMRVYKNLSTIKSAENVKAWIFKITRNLSIDHIRKRKRHNMVLLSSIDEQAVVADFTDVSENLDNQESAHALWEAMQEIAAEWRDILVQFYFNNCNCKEIAESFDCSEASIKTSLYRARKALHAVMTSEIQIS